MASGGTRRRHREPIRLGPGSRIADYVIEEQIGAGGMAVVFRAQDVVLGRRAAVKVLSPALAANADFRMRFLRESRAIAAVDEPHILPVYAAGESGGVLYIATRFVAGGDLTRLLRRSGGTLSAERAAALIAQVAAALDAAHGIGLVHRDVKPGNVLIDIVPGRPEHAYLSDFGLTKADASMTSLTADGAFLGTPDYCAPEQITGQAVSGRSDQYALGCVAFHLLTGTVPFPRADTFATLYAHVNEPPPAASAIVAGLPPAVDAVLARALAKRPEARYACCGEFAAALYEALRPPRPRGAPPAAPSRVGTAPWAAYQEPSWVNARSQVPPAATSSPLSKIPPAAWDDDPAHGTRAATLPASTPPDARARPKRAGKRRRLIIAGLAVAVLAAAGAGIALYAKPSDAPHLAFTLIPPGGAELSAEAPVMSTDGRYLAAAGASVKQPRIYVWNAETGKLQSTLNKLPANGMTAPLAFTTGDETLIALYYSPSAKKNTIYSIALSGRSTPIYTFPSSVNWAVSGDGSTLAFENSAHPGITAVNLSTGTTLTTLDNPAAHLVPHSLQLDNSGDKLIISSKTGTAYVMLVGQSATGDVLSTVPFRYSANGVASGYVPQLSPDGSTALAPDAADGWQLWNNIGSPGTHPSNITPDDPQQWPQSAAGCQFSAGGQVILCFPNDELAVDLWAETPLAPITGFSVPNSQDEPGLLGPGGHQLVLALKTGANSAFRELYVWDIPIPQG
jgi:serine/threonine protein kinase